MNCGDEKSESKKDEEKGEVTRLGEMAKTNAGGT